MDYRYTIDVLTEDGRPLDHAVVRPDWGAAFEWAHFEGVRAGCLPPLTRTGPGAVEPVWDERHGAPFVGALRVTVRAGAGVAVREISKTYLRDLAHDLCADLVKRGRLEKGGTYRWVLTAVPVSERSSATRGGGEAAKGEGDAETEPVPVDDDLPGLEAVARPIPLRETRLATFLERSVFAGPEGEDARHLPVFCPRAILDEAKEMARQSLDRETGGVLVGHLHRDGAAGAELFLEITAQIPAPHTVAESTKITFTAATWAAVRAAIARRNLDEILCGWWHSHLDWCRLRNCPPERRRTCSASDPFFSREDVYLHGTCFPSGHHMALLVSDSAATGGLTVSAFGWSQGMVVPRGFHVLGPALADGASDTADGASDTIDEKGATHDESIAS